MSPVRLLAIRVLITLALGFSGYLLFLSLSGSKAIGCGPDSGCDQVLSSRWSSWFQIPVSLLAVLADVVFLAGTFLLGRNLPLAQQRQGWAIVVPCAVLLSGAALWFVFLQLVIMRSICPYCMAAHTAGLLAALIALVSAPIFAPLEKSRKLERTGFITQAAFRRLSGLALLGVVGLILGQVVYAPKTYVEISQNIAGSPTSTSALNQAASPARTGSVTGTTSPQPGSARDSQFGNPGTDVPIQNTTKGTTAPLTTAAPLASSPPSPPPTPVGQRPFPLYNGRFFVDVANSPTLGAATNAQVAVALHDFTCSHCRELHPHLVEAQFIFSNQLVIVTLPMPFDPNCNPIMKRHNPKHTNACDYARLSLAVFRANPARQHEYDEFLFTGEKPPPLLAAQERAVQAVGSEALQKALNDPWVDQQIRLGIGLYATASEAGHASLPQLMVGHQVAVGILPTEVILDMLAKNLGLVVTSPSSTGRSP